MFPLRRRLYEALPCFAKRAACLVPFGVIAGSSYRSTMKRGQRTETASREDILRYQERALSEVLTFATEQVPAYRPFRGVVERLKPFDALKEFPLLDKDALQQDMASYLPRDFERIPHYAVTTGGTSGNQLRFYVDDNSQSVDIAFVHRLWACVGYTPRHRKATFRGVPFTGLKPGVFWQDNPVYNERQFSPFHMSDGNMGAYIQALVDYRPAYLHGYPSAITFMARHILGNRLEDAIPKIRAALLVSEGCDQGQRECIERAFRTRVFSFYGHSERVVMGGECEYSSDYHHVPDYGVLEILGPDGRECTEGQRGEIVGTGFLSRSLPLIRYRTGDSAVRLSPGCRCGREWDRFGDVCGWRHQEFLVGKAGARISLTALNMHGDLFDQVARYQYVQSTEGSCELRIMPAPGYRESDGLAILSALHGKAGDEVEFRIRLVDNIPLTDRGKLRRLVSSLAGCRTADEPSSSAMVPDAR